MCDFDTPVTLIAVKVTGRDDIGNPIRVEKSSEYRTFLNGENRELYVMRKGGEADGGDGG